MEEMTKLSDGIFTATTLKRGAVYTCNIRTGCFIRLEWDGRFVVKVICGGILEDTNAFASYWDAVKCVRNQYNLLTA